MIKTMNYQLNQWEPTDEVRREDFNSDNAAIDAAIKAVADTANSKAGTAEVSALSQTVSALTTALGSGGQTCRIAWGTYTGTGKVGSGNPNKLNFDFFPVVVLVASINGMLLSGPSIFLRNIASAHSEIMMNKLTVTWTGTGLSWYATQDLADQPGYYQNNIYGGTYYYCALGYSTA